MVIGIMRLNNISGELISYRLMKSNCLYIEVKIIKNETVKPKSE
jgi:hypothetical protein